MEVRPEQQKDKLSIEIQRQAEVPPFQGLLDLLLSGLSPACCESTSLFVRAEVSLEETSLESDDFEACGDFSGLVSRTGTWVGSGEQLSTAREGSWLESMPLAREEAGGARDAESECDRRWAVDSL